MTDVNTLFKSAILEFDATQTLVSRYCGLEPSYISRVLTGERVCTETEAISIRDTIMAMREVQAEMPLPVNWAMIGKVKPLVDQRRKELRDTADPIVKSCTLIRVAYTKFFLRVQNGEVVTTPSEMTAAAFESPGLAGEVVQQLRKLGTESRIEFFGAFRHRSTMSNTLVDVGLESAAIESADDGND